MIHDTLVTCFWVWNCAKTQQQGINVHCSIQTADWNWLAGVVSSLLVEAAQRLLAAQCGGEAAEEGDECDGGEPAPTVRQHGSSMCGSWVCATGGEGETRGISRGV